MLPDIEPPKRTHKHFCTTCHELYRCDCNHPEIEDLDCGGCDEILADQLAA